jgi:hypothetical protein
MKLRLAVIAILAVGIAHAQPSNQGRVLLSGFVDSARMPETGL